MRENRTSGSEGRESGIQPDFLTPIYGGTALDTCYCLCKRDEQVVGRVRSDSDAESAQPKESGKEQSGGCSKAERCPLKSIAVRLFPVNWTDL